MGERCETCRFARGFDRFDMRCHRRAPAPVPMPDGHRNAPYDMTPVSRVVGAFPPVRPDHWCGEWEEKT